MNQIFLGSLGFSIAQQRELSSIVADENLRGYLEAEENGLSLISVHSGSLKELIQKSIDDCLSKTPLLPEQIQAIYLSSNALDFQNLADCEWITSVIEQAGTQAAPIFYIGMAGCAGFHWLLQTSSNRIKLGQIQNALLMTFDKAEGSLQRIYTDDPNFIYVTGDAAAACIVSVGFK